MTRRPFPPPLAAALVAALLAALGLGGAWIALRPAGPPLVRASLAPSTLTPNADGDGDVVRLDFTLRRPADIAIYLLDTQGQRYDFRAARSVAAGEHVVEFSGVVGPYSLPGDDYAGQLLARVLGDGSYTWVVEAQTGAAAPQQITGTLAVSLSDPALPALQLTVSPPIFTPNQDGLTDRVLINVGLAKTIAGSGLKVYLVDPAGARVPIAEDPGEAEPGRAGLHTFNYDGGIDQGFEPPPDGTYTVVAEAEDRLGQKMAVTQTLAIALGGLPRAEILLGDVEWSASTLQIGQTLNFTLTVENYGTAPLRTSGPQSGWVYQSMNANYNTVGEYFQSGVWRVGLHCDTCQTDYPWRWALGDRDQFTVIPDEAGRPQYYLMPGERAVVRGGLVLDRVVASRNPQYFWAGLIHEDVEVANDRVDAALIEILGP